jgi:hypothetical protein
VATGEIEDRPPTPEERGKAKLWEMSDMVQLIEAWEAKQEETKKRSATAEQGAWQD